MNNHEGGDDYEMEMRLESTRVCCGGYGKFVTNL